MVRWCVRRASVVCVTHPKGSFRCSRSGYNVKAIATSSLAGGDAADAPDAVVVGTRSVHLNCTNGAFNPAPVLLSVAAEAVPEDLATVVAAAATEASTLGAALAMM